ncbi:GntR family transcriptional regulator [Desulfosarcina cetonica]|uniref:GntR family transcriptional regulator n=1 Tax=Desulfosarcina cetonica TaxID=90730 RepID=UPI0006D1CAA8|nr:winged helix-turn-helix domain-containing protein [Desulfosarcina cetonica]
MALYEEIAAQIRTQIVSGVYPPGKRIPSIRHFADHFGCNKLTVQRAFERLTADGLLEKIVGSGSYVKFPETIQAAGEVYDLSTDYLSESFFPHGVAGAFSRRSSRATRGPPLPRHPLPATHR